MTEHAKTKSVPMAAFPISTQSPIPYKDHDLRRFTRNSTNRKECVMRSKQAQVMQMIENLSDDDLAFLIDFMKRFMISNDTKTTASPNNTYDTDFWEEMENMRTKARQYFPDDIEPEKIWEEAINEKYGDIN
jgi:hypothetical protein